MAEEAVVHPGEVGAEFVWRMEDVLDLYEQPYDSNKPLICFDELPYQLVAETRTPIAAKPGQPARYDYDYERKGTTPTSLRFSSRRQAFGAWR